MSMVKVTYSRDVDAMIIELSGEPPEYGKEIEGEKAL